MGEKKVKGRPAGALKVTLNLRIDPEIARQLKVHALLADATVSDVVAALVRAHLRVYTITSQDPCDGEVG